MQLEFLWRDESAFQSELEAKTGSPIAVTLTNNSSSIMTFKSSHRSNPARLRIHRMFLAAGPEVITALAEWLTRHRSPRSAKVLDVFIKEHEHLIAPAKDPSFRIRSEGIYHDLRRYFDELNGEYFGKSVVAPITWGRAPTTRRRRSIRLGSYTPEDDLIRIHPYLDQSFVPEYFVRYIVFHEMLHAQLGVETASSGRRRIHTPEFNQRERAYADYERAVAWHDEPKNLRRLLRSPRKAA